MKKSYLLIVFLFVFVDTNAQNGFIVAGQHSSNDYYYSFMPDSVVIKVPKCTYGYYSLDINNDGVLDFKFALDGCSGLGGWGYVCSISALNNNNNVALGYNDTCFDKADSTYYVVTGIAHAFNYNDTINNNAGWTSEVDLEYGQYSMNSNYCSASYSSDTAYLGVRVMVDTVYKYGWIRIANVVANPFDSSTLKMGTFACENNATGVETFAGNKYEINLYPNPANTIMNLTVRQAQGSKNYEVSIINVLGEEVKNEKFLGKNDLQIDISDLREGVYFIQIKAAEGIATSKVIVQR